MKFIRLNEVNMKKRFVLSLLLLLIFFSSAAAQNWFKGTLDDAVVKSKNEGKKVLIDFFSDG